MIRFGLGRIKVGVGTSVAIPSHGSSLPGATVTPEQSSVTPTAPGDGDATTLRITDIQPYEKNPRQAANPRFDAIKASIRQRGMDAPLTVTRRPDATHYVVAAGGNTRLLAQLQLWQETADPRFETVPAVIKPWRSESDVLAGHLIENEQRADMTFWDKARGVVALKAELEQERAAALSLRQWESALLEMGLPIGKDVLGNYLFAVERLTPLGPVVATLSRNDVRDYLQPRFGRLGRLAQKFGLGEVALYAHTLDPVMVRFAALYQATHTFAAVQLAEEGDVALAQTLQISLPTLQAMLALHDESPELALTELQARATGATLAGPIRTERTTPHSRERGAGADDNPGTVSPGDRRLEQEDSGGGAETRSAVSRGDSHAIEVAGAATTASAAHPVDAFKVALLRFAQLTLCTDDLRWRDGLPLDFYVEVPTAPLDLEPTTPRRHAGWWLLAFLSGQLDPALAALLPEDSRWRRTVCTDGGWSDERLALLIDTELGGSLAPDALVAWLIRTPDVAAESAWQCLEWARRTWRRRAPATPSGSPDAANTS